ncbi:hypothetical protein D8B26_002937 [Coccidioides posadasii str. Silveira]|uniref:Uncharacterized protein n=3 Tax=Coccidioides posadasii TaxID=199306 RepID=E9CXR5_COCPS|nr:Zinc finger, C3HC4 type (RING finger) domain containing protein [Coccidioides posadasii C735 delta SOWgp]EER26665.1 Zinc finger, C3HC4 type (RING finger) domain containing protein [Coccidioides posadasii C735 delta SOWgp]EFW20742.1 conserved hypothetical protein [Coccidioides posadasii str. Silveira]KMM72701.1 hypothetical protein CPAG_08995 [Coccidioides posadasii RMSCC 3488]QVM08243.1 hypothetical protein D8B26_002937 [Coccidioides posadasii str. Silveira]|eukprot:XP_003068810.1 Zinc finger, C3HC4 type (RING finger) domain containing protein [Coccidioides posadasii C735 delta SOWgp]
MALQQGSSSRRQTLPPSQVDCIWWKKGYCYRGTKCYFRHDAALAGIDKDKDSPRTAKSTEPGVSRSPEPASPSTGPAQPRESCAICLEVPVTYGLLIHCDHVFCLDCIRSWRSSSNNEQPEDPDYMTDQAALSKTTKTCPLCRKKSTFIVPSSIFPTPPIADSSASTQDKKPASGQNNLEGAEEIKNPVKEEIIQGYLSRLKKIPCRYFNEEVRRWREAITRFETGHTASQPLPELSFQPQCYFANECHYAHTDPLTNEPYIFSQLEIRRMKRKRAEERNRQLRARFHYGPAEQLEMLTRTIEAFSFNDDATRDSSFPNGSGHSLSPFSEPEDELQELGIMLSLSRLRPIGHPGPVDDPFDSDYDGVLFMDSGLDDCDSDFEDYETVAY